LPTAAKPIYHIISIYYVINAVRCVEHFNQFKPFFSVAKPPRLPRLSAGKAGYRGEPLGEARDLVLHRCGKSEWRFQDRRLTLGKEITETSRN
jgi:hypothetical protein